MRDLLFSIDGPGPGEDRVCVRGGRNTAFHSSDEVSSTISKFVQDVAREGSVYFRWTGSRADEQKRVAMTRICQEKIIFGREFHR